MDPENENQDEEEINASNEEARKSSSSVFEKLKRKAKNDFFDKLKKTIIPVILPVVLKLMVPLIILATILLLASSVSDWFVSLFGNDNVSSLAVEEVLSDTEIVKGDDDGYYFSIDPDLVEKYIKELNEAYKNGNYYLDDEENEEILKEYGKYKDENGEIVEEGEEAEDEGTDEDTTNITNTNDEFTSDDLQDWFASDQFRPYFIRMLRAEIASSYPKLGTEGSFGKQTDKDGKTIIKSDRVDGKIINPQDKSGNYIAQGIIQVRRSFLEDVPNEEPGPGDYTGNAVDVDSIIGKIKDPNEAIVLVNCDGTKLSLGVAVSLNYLKQEGPIYDEKNEQYITKFSFENGNIKDTLEITLKTRNGYVINGSARITGDNTKAFEFPTAKVNGEERREIDIVFDDIKQNIVNAGGLIDEDPNLNNQEDKSIELTYLPYDEFKDLSNRSDKDALNYFSFDSEKGLIYYYTYTQVYGANENSFTLNENSVRYKTLTNMCSMPYNFLFALLQTTNDPEWVMAVVDQLLIESEAVILIQDQRTTTVVTDTYSYLQETETTTKGEDGTESKKMSSPSYPYNSYTQTTTTVQYTARAFINKAYTWCMNYEQRGTLTTQTTGPSVTSYTPSNLGGYSFNKSYENGNTTVYQSTQSYLSSSSTTTTSITCNVDEIQEKEISEKFLSTWKNKTGKYKLGEEYDQTGKEIKYKFPYRIKASSIPPDTLSEMSEYGIDIVLDLLKRHEDTQLHEQLLMYYWNIYTGQDIYDIDLEALLELFEEKISLNGSLLANFIMSHENLALWKYITGQSAQAPTKYITSDGQNYIVYEDGSGGRHNIAFGMATFLVRKRNNMSRMWKDRIL